MVRLTQSLQHWLWENHRDKISLIMLGHTELMTEEMAVQYIKWCQTKEGQKYLVGGSEYKDNEPKKLTDEIKVVSCTCGGKPEHIKLHDRKHYECFLRCDTCGFETQVYASKQSAIIGWNRAMIRRKKDAINTLDKGTV